MNKSTTSACAPWNTTPSELASILAEMRPIIDRFAERDRQLVVASSNAA